MDFVGAVLPTIGLALLFWYVIRAIFNGDRREREELARWEAAEDARAAAAVDVPGEDGELPRR